MKRLLHAKCSTKASEVFFSEDIHTKIQSLPGELPELIKFLCNHSPYINRLICSELEWLSSVVFDEFDQIFDQIIIDCKKDIYKDTFFKVRVAKRRTILVIALADFGNLFNLAEVTDALSVFADKIIELIMDLCTFNEFQRVDYRPIFKNFNSYPKKIQNAAHKSGLCSFGMGKLGSFELNYSSDIDLIFLFDEEKFKPEYYSKARNVFIKIVRQIVKTLSEVTSEGYVFRVDLRLRPDPSTNPVCIGAMAAQRYYENFGRNWERAAFIKARYISGDESLGKKFLRSLNSFIWRKNLDFGAIEDINDIRKKIRKKNPSTLTPNLLGCNIKTGVGGIREIEFFVQTQQLIRGGKNKSLRVSATVKALCELKHNSLISQKVCQKLLKSYEELRFLEHILQLIEDTQTHSIPNCHEKVKGIAMLFGIPNSKKFLSYIFKLLTDVNAIITELYSRFDPLGDDRLLNRLTMNQDELIVSYVDKWLTYKALRTERALKIFDELLPFINHRILQTQNTSNTLFYFDNFLKSLSFGVQVLSLFKVNPAVLDLLIEICGAAPALAEYLGKNPSVLEVVTDHKFFLPLSSKKELIGEFNSKVNEITDFESILDYARIFAKEKQFRTGVHLLKAFSSIECVSQSFSNIAEVCLVILFDKVRKVFSERYGEVSGLGPSLLAMGKLGSEEMSIASDLDLIIIYHAEIDAVSNGKKSVPAQVYYSRLTQAFISAITVATSEGHLFKVDMRLRPSGNKGPVATSIASFENYQVNEAWVWERLALSRARVLTGNVYLRKRLNFIIAKALHSGISATQIKREVHEMRLRLMRQKHITLLDLKLGAGKLQDLELLIQMGGLQKKSFHSCSPFKMIGYLKENKFFSEEEAEICERTYSFYFCLQQILNITGARQINENSMNSIKDIMKNHDFIEVPKDIKKNLNNLSQSIDNIFKIKLQSV